MESYKILQIDENHGDQVALQDYVKDFKTIKVELEQVKDLVAAKDRIAQTTFDLVILDLDLELEQGVKNVQTLLESYPQLNILILSSDDRLNTALSAIQLGANDFVIKQETSAALLEKSIRFCIERFKLNKEKSQLEWELQYQRKAINFQECLHETDLDGNFVFVNDKFCESTGYRKEELIGKPTSLVESEVHSPDFYNKIKSQLKQGKTWTGELCYRNKNGSTDWYNATITPKQLPSSGETVGLFSLLNNISALKETQKELDSEKSALYNTLNSIPHEIWSVDKEFRLTSINKVFRDNFSRFFGVELKVGDSFKDLKELPQEVWELWKSRYQKAFQGSSLSYRDEYPWPENESQVKSIQVQVSPTLNKKGEIIGAGVFSEDVSELIQKSEDLERLNQNLLEAQKLGKMGNWSFYPKQGSFHVSHGIEELFQLQESNLETIESLLENVNQKDKEDFLARLPEALKGHSFVQTLRVKAKSDISFLEVSIYPKTNAQGEVYIEGICRDITQLEVNRQFESAQKTLFRDIANSGMQLIGSDNAGDLHHRFGNIIGDWLKDEAFFISTARFHENGKDWFEIVNLKYWDKNLLDAVGLKRRKRYPIQYDLEKLLSGRSVVQEFGPEIFNYVELLETSKSEVILKQFPNSRYFIYPLTFEGKVQGVFLVSFLKNIPKQFSPEVFEMIGNQANAALKALKYQEKLNEKTLVLNQALTNANSGVWRYDLLKRQIFGDQNYTQLIGEKVGANLALHSIDIDQSIELIHPDDREKARMAFREYLEGQVESYSAEMRYKCADGEYHWFEDRGKITRTNEKGEPLELIGTRTNIDLRKKRLERLNLFQNVMDKAREGILITDNNDLKNGGPYVLYANPAMYALSGYMPEEFIGKNPRLLQGPDTDPEALRYLSESIRKGEAAETELINYHKDGHPYWLRLSIVPVKNEEGLVTHFISLQKDITEEREKQKEYKELMTRFELALSANEMGVWDYDIQNNVLIWDDNMVEIYEVSKDNLKNRVEDWQICLHPADRENAVNHVNEAIKGSSEDFYNRFRIQTQSGTKHISGRAKIYRDKDGLARRMVGLNWDISKIANYEEELAEALHERESILSSVNEGFVTLDGKLNILYANNAAIKMLDLKSEEEGTIELSEVFKPHQHEALYEKIKELKKTGDQSQLTCYFQKSSKWFDISIYPNFNGFSLFVQDITEIRKRKAEVERITRNTQALINATEDHMWSIDPTYRILSANQGFLNYLNLVTGERLGIGDKVIEKSQNQSGLDRWKPLYEKALAGSIVRETLEIKIQEKQHIFSVNLYPIYNSQQVVTAVACYSYDDTERLNYLRTVEKQNGRLQEIAWLQSHVLRAPLARIMGLIELYKTEDSTSEEQVKDYLEFINESAHEMDRVVREITAKTDAYKLNQN